ncbi:MAG: nuclear transport factor 2 family protein [Opitutus sp.]|nr:nuclear transport factor 2 family protein [Opitutus sp.]
MKISFFLPLLALAFVSVRAESSAAAKPDDKVIAAVRAADDERVAAILAADPARLNAIFSDDLTYTHSSGKIDNKASYTKSLVTKATTYDHYEYLDRKFIPVSPGIVLMTAHALIYSRSATGRNENDLSLLAVYREEQGKWRFLAWQSAKLPAPAAAPAKK